MTPGSRSDQIVVKFVEGSHVRLRGGRLTIDSAQISAAEASRLSRKGMNPAAAQKALTSVQKHLSSHSSIATSRLFQRAEADLDSEKSTGEALGGEELADLNLYYQIDVAPGLAQSLLSDLNASDLVEVAYAAPIATDAAADIAPPTPSFVANQGYLNQAPGGVDAKYSWTVSGGTGTNVKIIDVEQGWQTTHEDLNLPFVTLGPNCAAGTDHGTAVLGEMVSQNNAYGVTGISYSSTYGVSRVLDASCNWSTTNVANAISAAAGQLGAGDIILIEQHAPGPESNTTCTGCNCGQWKFVPMEYYQADYDAIKAATNNGKVVVEAAGNGEVNLDSAVYGQLFQLSFRDSGAIMVGAGLPNTRQPECYTNYGSRVDVQGWGSSVMTAGYGTPAQYRINGNDQNQWYTSGFSGTSSASPIVTGAAADIQGNRKALGQPVLTSQQIRSKLASTGTAQPTPVTKKIGPLPNLRAALSPAQPPANGNVTAVRQSTNITATFAVGADGALYRRQASGTGAFGSPVAMTSTNFAPPGANVAVGFQATNQLDAFVIGNDGKLYYFKEVNDGAWTGPTAISSTAVAPPGAPIATNRRSIWNQLDVFFVDSSGALRVYWVIGTSTTWNGPLTIATNFAPAGAKLATGIQGTDQHDVFAIGNDGALKVAWVVGVGPWFGPLNISGPSVAPPGASVATGKQGSNQLDVFFVGNDGIVKAAFVVGTGIWNAPVNLHLSAIASAGAAISASAQGTNQLDVFVVSTNGTVNALFVVGLGFWQGPLALTGSGVAISGAKTAPATQGTNQLDLLVVANAGLSVTTTTGGPWSALTKLP